MNRQWSQLSLRQIPRLKAEVEQVCKTFAREPSEELYQAISLRIDELEAFYLDNDSDKRAILIDKLRVQLQSILQAKPLVLSEQDHGESCILTDQQQVQVEEKCGNSFASSESTKIPEKAARKRPLVGGKRKTNNALYTWEQQHWKNTSNKDKHNLRSPPPPPPPPLPTQTPKENETEASSTESKSVRLLPAQEADRVAALSYAAAHAGDVAFLTPFGNWANFGQKNCSSVSNDTTCAKQGSSAASYPSSGDALAQYYAELEQDSCNSTISGASSTVIAKFKVKLSEEDYFEIMRRREIHLAKQACLKRQAQKKAQMGRSCMALKLESEIRREMPYFDPLAEHCTRRNENRSSWISDHNFYVSSAVTE